MQLVLPESGSSAGPRGVKAEFSGAGKGEQTHSASRSGSVLLCCRRAALCFPSELLAPCPVQLCQQRGIQTSALQL